MPKVPTYDNFEVMPEVPKGAYLDTSKVAVDKDSLPGRQMQQLGDAMLKAGTAGMEIAIRDTVDTNQAVVKERDNQLADILRDIRYNTESGYLNMTGKNAVDMHPDSRKAVQEAVRKAGEGLSGAQYRLFQNIALHRQEHALTEIDTHAARQTRVYNVESSKARIITNEADMMASFVGWKTPGSAYEKSDATRQLEVENMIALTIGANADPAMKRVARMESSTRAHLGIIDQMIAGGKIDDAKAYLGVKADEIDPKQHDNITKAIAAAGEKAKAMSYTDELFASVKGYAPQMKKVQTDFAAGRISADERQIIEARIDHARALQKSQQAEWDSAVVGQAQEHILKGGSLDTLPPSLYVNLKNTGHLGSIAAFARAEGKPETNYEAYYGLRHMAANDPAQFARTDLLQSRHLLSPHHWETLVNLQGQIGKKDAAAMDQQAVLSRTLKSIKSDMQAAGLDLTPKEGSDPAKKLALFNASLIDALDVAQRQKKSPLEFDEARKIGLSLLKEGWEQDGGFIFGDSFKKRRFEARSTDKFYSVTYGDIPAQHRAVIETGMRNAGQRITKAEVERIYQRALDAGRVQ